MVYNGSREKLVRALIDSRSRRSYICADLAEEIGYEPIEKERIVHALFGGVTTKNVVHNIYKAHVRDLNNTFACNFDVRDQKIICGDISKVKSDSYLIEELIKQKHLAF